MAWYQRIGQRPAWERALEFWQSPPRERVVEMRPGG